MGMTALAEIGGANPATGTTRHFAHDHLGSLRTAWGADRTLRARAEYLPYGEFLAGITDERIPASLFTGKSLDFETMLYHFPYRYYNLIAARWLTRDPLGMVDGPNVYAYVNSRPTIEIDPMGSKAKCSIIHSACRGTCHLLAHSFLVSAVAAIGTATATCIKGCASLAATGIGALGFPACVIGCGVAAKKAWELWRNNKLAVFATIALGCVISLMKGASVTTAKFQFCVCVFSIS